MEIDIDTLKGIKTPCDEQPAKREKHTKMHIDENYVSTRKIYIKKKIVSVKRH